MSMNCHRCGQALDEYLEPGETLSTNCMSCEAYNIYSNDDDLFEDFD